MSSGKPVCRQTKRENNEIETRAGPRKHEAEIDRETETSLRPGVAGPHNS